MVNVEFLHEIIFGYIQIIKSVNNAKLNPYQSTYSWRMRQDRYEKKYKHWLTIRMNSDGWDNLGDRLEILHGPDHLGQLDLILYQGENRNGVFQKFLTTLSCRLLTREKRSRISTLTKVTEVLV